MKTPPLKFAMAAYLNAAPLAEGLYRRSDVQVVHGFPADLGRMVKKGDVDAGLMPVVDHLFDPELNMLDGMGVCSDGRVKSVVLRARCAVKDIKAVASDAASHTSNLLARLILKAAYGVEVKMVPAAEAAGAEASVVIGDAALAMTPESGFTYYDLATEWKKLTGLPFVFAVWTYRTGNSRAAELMEVALSSLKAGLSAIDDIAVKYSRDLNLSLEVCREYLRSCVYYKVGKRENMAIHEFARLVSENRLAPEKPFA